MSAGKEETPVAPKAPAQPMSEDMAVKRFRYYFFDAPPEKKIPFKDIAAILKSSDDKSKSALIENLKGNDYQADYFRWLKVAVVTNQYSSGGKGSLVYEAVLSPWGTKVDGKETITPTNLGVTVDTVEKDLLLFSTKMSSSNVINIDTSGEARFINGAPPANLTNVLLGGGTPAKELMTYEQFKGLFNEFRVWFPTSKQLVLPDLSTPTQLTGMYAGGKAAFNELVGPLEAQSEKPVSQAPSLGEKVQEEPIFSPVKNKTSPVQGQYLDDTTQGAKMAAQNTNSIRRVVLAFIKSAAYGTVAPATTPSNMTAMPGKKRPSIPVSDIPEENLQGAQTLTTLAKDQKKMNQQIQNLQKNIGQRAQQLSTQSYAE
jgi:hypothetical protein